MKDNENRVVGDLVQWMEIENDLRKHYGPDIIKERHVQMEKLKAYGAYLDSYNGPKSLKERVMINVMKGEKDKLFKQVYPNSWVRTFMKGVDRFGSLLIKLEQTLNKNRKNKEVKVEPAKPVAESTMLKRAVESYKREFDKKMADKMVVPQVTLNGNAKTANAETTLLEKKSAEGKSLATRKQESVSNVNGEDTLLPKNRTNGKGLKM